MTAECIVQLERSSKQALYQQIATQIKTQICDGRLPIKSRLPTVRSFANSLKVTRLTIQSAYNELQADGWIECTVGKGTYVSESVKPQSLMSVVARQPTPDTVLDNISRVSQIVGLRSLAYAEADPMLFPASEFWSVLSMLQTEAVSLLQHGSPQGDSLLRIELAGLCNEQKIEVVPSDILVTSGVLQGLSLLVQALTKSGECIAVEQPTYHGMLNILKLHGVQAYGIPFDTEGPVLDALEHLIIERHPRFFYTIPNFHNPTGRCMSLERRRGLLALAKRHNLMIVEDDCYGRLAYDAPPLPTLKSLDNSGIVIYLSGVSKIMMSGLRIGYIIAPEPIRGQLLVLRRAADLCNPLLIQRAVAEFIRRGRLKTHLKHVIPIYRERRNTLIQTLESSMPRYVHWTYPSGGFSCWLSIPQDKIPDQLHKSALEYGIAFTPGEVFSTVDDGDMHLRLCFGNQTSEVIREVILLLSRLIRG